MKPLTKDTVDMIRYGTETRRWEFKSPMAWSNNQRERKSELTRAALALSNIAGGGFIVIGISQKRDRSSGIKFERKGLDSHQFASFNNSDDIARFFNARSNRTIKFAIFGDGVRLKSGNKKFIVIQVFESENFTPIICTQEFNPSARYRHCRLSKGTLYIRSISNPVESRAISSQEEWEEMILRLLVHKEEILHKDLMAICHSIKKEKKAKKLSKKISRRSKGEYDKVLKRDKLE